MTGKLQTEQAVRSHARFKCENCDEFVVAQYAHIIPDSDSGEYDFNNLLFLCYPCHRNYEPAITSSELKQARIKHLKNIKDREKIDSVVEGIFELPADKKVTVNLGGGLKVVDTPDIFTEDPTKYANPSRLSITTESGLLQINGLLKDESFSPIIEFSGTKFKLHTKDYWDIIRKPGKLELINRSKKLKLRIHQQDDLSLLLRGTLYIGNRKVVLKANEMIFLPEKIRFIDSLVSNSGGAFLFA